MLTLVLLLLVNSIVSQELLGVVYSFNDGFVRDFDKLNCGDKDDWFPIDYSTVNVPPYFNSSKGIRSTKDSCASSFPFVMVQGGKIEVALYTRLISEDSGADIIVTDKTDHVVAKYVLKNTTFNYRDGWTEISMDLNAKGVGKIKLLGSTGDNELVIIDSFRYVTNRLQDQFMENDDGDFIFSDAYKLYNHGNKHELTDFEDDDIFRDESGSGDDESETVPETSESTDDGALGAWAITLIVVASVTVLAIVIVAAYHLGKLAVRSRIPDFMFEVEPPRNVRIPRVRSEFNPNSNLEEFM